MDWVISFLNVFSGMPLSTFVISGFVLAVILVIVLTVTGYATSLVYSFWHRGKASIEGGTTWIINKIPFLCSSKTYISDTNDGSKFVLVMGCRIPLRDRANSCNSLGYYLYNKGKGHVVSRGNDPSNYHLPFIPSDCYARGNNCFDSEKDAIEFATKLRDASKDRFTMGKTSESNVGIILILWLLACPLAVCVDLLLIHAFMFTMVTACIALVVVTIMYGGRAYVDLESAFDKATKKEDVK